jgi:lipase
VHRFGAVDGAPLLALHGVTGHGIRFQRLAEEGLPERRVIAPDLRGHGRSTWEPPWNAERLVTDLVELLDAEGLERTDVMGHSYGGLLATLLIARAPDRVGRAVLLDPAGRRLGGRAGGVRRAPRGPAAAHAADGRRRPRRDARRGARRPLPHALLASGGGHRVG